MCHGGGGQDKGILTTDAAEVDRQVGQGLLFVWQVNSGSLPVQEAGYLLDLYRLSGSSVQAGLFTGTGRASQAGIHLTGMTDGTILILQTQGTEHSRRLHPGFAGCGANRGVTHPATVCFFPDRILRDTVFHTINLSVELLIRLPVSLKFRHRLHHPCIAEIPTFEVTLRA